MREAKVILAAVLSVCALTGCGGDKNPAAVKGYKYLEKDKTLIVTEAGKDYGESWFYFPDILNEEIEYYVRCPDLSKVNEGSIYYIEKKNDRDMWTLNVRVLDKEEAVAYEKDYKGYYEMEIQDNPYWVEEE